MKIKDIDNKVANNSATIIEDHTPSIFQKIGNINTHNDWKTRVRKNEIEADITPLFNAVKKDEE